MLKRESLSFGITLSPKSTVPVLVERLSSISSGESVIDGTKIFGSKLTQAVRGNVNQRKQNREKLFIVQKILFFFIYLRYPILSPPQYPYIFSNLLGSLILIISEKFLIGFILYRKANKIKNNIMN